MSLAEESAVLSSWKDIARYLGKGVRTVQRWERHHGLPVRRPPGASQKSAVMLHRADVDAWLSSHFSPRQADDSAATNRKASNLSVRADLRENMRRSLELRRTHLKLTRQIAESIALLRQRCDGLAAETTQAPWGRTTSGLATSPTAPSTITRTNA